MEPLRDIQVGMWATSMPGRWLAVLRVEDNGNAVIVSDYVDLPNTIGHPTIAMLEPSSWELGWPDWANPVKWVGAVDDAVSALWKPGIYAASIFTGGLPGLVAAWAADRTGVMDAIGKLAAQAGGIYLDLLGSFWFQSLCTALGIGIGVPEMAIGCVVGSLAIEILNVIIRGKMDKLPGIVKRAWRALSQVGLELDQILDGIFNVVFTGLADAGFSVESILNQAVGPVMKELQKVPFIDALKLDTYKNKLIKQYGTGAIKRELDRKVNSTVSNAVSNTGQKLDDWAAKSSDPQKIPSGPVGPNQASPIFDMRAVNADFIPVFVDTPVPIVQLAPANRLFVKGWFDKYGTEGSISNLQYGTEGGAF